MHNTNRNGFTLMELLLVLGILAILSTIVLIAINPTKQLNDAQGVSRNVAVREIENAISQYIIDGNPVTGVPTIKANALNICRDTITGTACTNAPVSGYDLSVLTTNGKYLVNIPIDPNETDTNITGYKIYKLGSFVKVCSLALEGDCGS
jgi:prepilin-type N-terminal cleavage/methylation domain-containing protein